MPPKAPLVADEPQPGQVAMRWLGQGGWAFRSPDGVVWLVDPYLSSYSSRAGFQRLAPAPVRGVDVQADAVLCTHNHSDHVDPITLPEIAQAAPSARFYAAAEGAQKLRDLGIPSRRIQTVQWHARGVPVQAIGATSTDVTADVVFASHSGDAVGYVLNVGAEGARPLRVYVTGDTLYDAQLISDATRQVDVLCVCINGRGGNMTHQEAARLAGDLSAATVIPMHYGVMPHNTIEPQLFLDALAAQSVRATPRVLAIGETFLVGR
jgi:L-ascorbate metabolism protein UlaG (beta-lactamase superfamily)